MKKLLSLVLLISLTVLFQSCQNYSDGRMLKKFISRFNAEEYASAATYVYPGDRMNVAFFANEVKTLAPHTFIKLDDYRTEGSDDKRFIKATLKWENTTPALLEYFNNIGHPLDKNGMQVVDLQIRDTNDGETIEFPWGIPDVLPENLWLTNKGKDDKSDNRSISLYSEPSFKSEKVEETSDCLVVGQEENGWHPVYRVSKNGDFCVYYIPQDQNIKLDRTAFFHLGIFDSIGVILALIIIIVIIVPFFYLGSLIQVFSNIPIGGPVGIILLICGIIYVIYQLLEQILFELFIINLPY